jgi:hypothetical protein
MSKKSVADASAELYKLLEPLDPAERARVVKGTLILLGDAQTQMDVAAGASQATQQQQSAALPHGDAKAYFNKKGPQGMSESLACAARYSETIGGNAGVLREDFERVFEAARRNFPSKSFARDIDNAVRSGFFRAGGSKKAGYTLSAHGQDYIDALPDRTAAKAIERPKRAPRGKAKRKKGPKGSAG